MKRSPGAVLPVISLLVAILAMGIGAFALVQASRIRAGLLETITQARSTLSSLENRTLEIPVRIQQTFPVRADVPIREEFVVPIRTTLPVSTEVAVPLRLPLLGERQIVLPIQAEVPISVEVRIPISRTVNIETSLSVDLEVPVRIETDRLGLKELLWELDTRLGEVEQRLR